MSSDTEWVLVPREANWKEAPPGATHYQPQQGAYYKRVSASEWYVWSRNEDRELMRWLPSPGTSDNAEWVVPPAECADGCPDQQVCDHCQWPSGPDAETQDAPELMVRTPALAAQRHPAMRPLYAYPPPSASVGVEGFVVRHYIYDEGPTIKGNGFDGLRVGDDRDEAEEFVRWVNAALAQQPAACPKCGGTGEADSGGVMPWGAPAMTLCECQQPAAVDEAMVERVTEAVVGWATLPGDSPAEPELVAELREVISAALAAKQGGAE